MNDNQERSMSEMASEMAHLRGVKTLLPRSHYSSCIYSGEWLKRSKVDGINNDAIKNYNQPWNEHLERISDYRLSKHV